MKYVVGMGSGGQDIHTKFQDDWFRHSSNIKLTTCMIYIPSFIKIGSGIQRLLGGTDTKAHRQQGDLISLLLFFQNKQIRLKN
jgi:hypothetical protein